MLKRTLGRSLLILIMLTGFAGTIDNAPLSGKERKMAVTMMKDSKSRVLNSVKGLSKEQLTFKSAPDKWSIQDCIYHIAATEKALWAWFEKSMKEPANPEKRAEIKMSDDEFVKSFTDRSRKFQAVDKLQPANTGYNSLDEALADFKQQRSDHIKYMKNTTEDLRNHVVQMAAGMADCYQLCLLVAGHSERHVLQIDEIKADPSFPKQ